MLRLIRNNRTLPNYTSLSLPHKTLRNSSNYFGAFNQFKLSKDDLKISSPVQIFIEKYRKYGHHYSRVDPLELSEAKTFPTLSDFNLEQNSSLKGALSTDSYINKLGFKDLKQLEEFLSNTYTKSVGVEFEHVTNSEEREWLYNQFEENMSVKLSNEEKKKILNLLNRGEAVDHFLAKKFQTFKRYSGEGTESLLVALNTIFASASDSGVTDIVLAMPHRGRFNVLLELLDYPAKDLFHKISGKNDLPDELYTAIDDVASHLAVSVNKSFSKSDGQGSKPIHVSLLHNPSHLEAVNPVSMGKTKAKQDDTQDTSKTFNVQLHGDAAFAGQGIVYESFTLSRVPYFTIDGSIHIICNNQVGFTTTANNGRSTQYSSDIVKPYGVPVIHVNADNAEEVLKVCELAVQYRQKFKKDIMIDLIGYRRYGHNELDEPEFTQPLMYKKIRGSQTTVPKKYLDQLVSEGVYSQADYDQVRTKVNEELEESFKAKESYKKTLDVIISEDYKGNRAFTGNWKDCTFSQYGKDEKTGLDLSELKRYANASVHTPEEFEPHQRIKKHHIQTRLGQSEKNGVDWATAEALAFASLLSDGNNIRFSGQDVERGTFSHRHLVFTDINNEKKWSPFKQAFGDFSPKGRFQLCNSPLSEASVLGFEFGYSMESPKNLVLWEAQFGDFFNPAQIIFDTFLTCSESKWLRQSSLVVLLPHGMDGAGPEHSSCRIERFLQNGSSDGGNRLLSLKEHDANRKRLDIKDQSFYENHQDVNFQFAVPTTPANYFHILRRQLLRNYRKPLIIASPKILLKHPQAKSKFEEMGPDTEFQPLYVHQGEGGDLSSVETAIFCSGKISYDIKAALSKSSGSSKKVALFVVEELLPFPESIIKQELAKVNKAAKVVWIQEETLNAGAFSYAEPRIARVLRELDFENQDVICHARRSLHSTAVGASEVNSAENKSLLGTLSDYI